jgi:hypothetical protein
MTIYDTCIKITGAFEGSDYDTITGNFDGCGISCGVLQFNLGTGTLQRYILNFCNVDNYRFPVSIRPLKKLSPEDSVKWTKDIMLDANGKVKPEWAASWREFLSDPIVVNLQKRAMDKYFHQAKCIAGQLGLPHDNVRAMAWAFDLSVQSWSLGIERPQINDAQCESIMSMADSKNAPLWLNESLDDTQKLLLIASHLRSLKCNQKWKHAFFVRKATIAIGIGYVNGTVMNFKNILR